MDTMKQKCAADVLILIHAFPLDSTMYKPLVDVLGRTVSRDHIITPDLPGFGQRSGTPERLERLSMESLADDVHTLIDQRAGGKAIVGGCSVGGYILLALLRKHPQSVAGAILFDTHPAADSPEVQANRLQAISEVRQNGLAGLVRTMPDRQLSPHAPAALRAQVAETIARQSVEGVIGLQLAMASRRDQTDLLPTLTMPLLLIGGAGDTITPPAMMRAMAQKCTAQAALKHVVIPVAGHLAPLEAPVPVADAILEFINKVEKPH
jgi:pimeloyl-ACP methyl ester carboxylesterase